MYFDRYNIWHTKWYGSTLATLLILITTLTIYDWLYLMVYDGSNNHPYLLALKIVPLTCLIFQGLFYFSLYGFHYYAILVTVAFFFCLAGDVLLAISNCLGLCPYFLTGGISFAVARIVMIISLVIYPYRKIAYSDPWNSPSWKKLSRTSIPTFIYLIIAVAYFSIALSDKNIKVRLLVCAYICLMTCHTYIATIRIGWLKIESNFSTIINLVGVWLFCISDTLLFYNTFVFTTVVFTNKVISIISLNIYWLAMFLISLSIIRNITDFKTEKYGVNSIILNNHNVDNI